MKIERIYSLIAVLFLMGTAAKGQIYPITAHVQLNPPTTTYLTDFTLLGSDRLSVNLFLNDFNEPIYDVRLKLTIEGNGISLVTHPSYVPPMITLSPGANLFSGSDLANFLSPNHMLINGITPQALQQGGSGLPEGIYTFCVEVFDYRRPEVALSLNHCGTKLLRKNYPPTLVFPACGTTIPVLAGNQDILFQWHANADLSIQTLYELSLVEVPPGMNPDDAMNGSSTKILDSEPVMGTTFLYGPNQLPLEIGKKYAYRIKALDVQGNTTFENNGRSPVCTFYYGVDANGMVPLVSPLPNALASTTTQLTLSWERPSNALPSQQVYYKLKIVRLLDGQEPDIALEYNPVWYEFETPVVPGSSVSKVIPASLYPMPPEERYAWEVKAYSENNGVEQEVAVSEKRVYKTLPAVEKFKAGNPDPNIISVITLTKNEDIANFQKKISGVGRMQIRENGEEVVLHFTDIVVGPFQGSLWQMEQGVITEPLNNFLVHLDNSGNPAGDPGNMDNYGRADFDATHVIVEKDDLKLKGRVKWKFPHAAAGGMPVVQSADTAIIYNRYKLVNAYVAVEGISFDLLDPYGFKITYYPSAAPGAGMTAGSAPGAHTKFALYDNILTLTLDGEMLTPVNAVDLSGNRVAYKFQDADNPYYFSQSGMGADRDIRMVKNTQIQLDALSAIFDLSEDQSPLKISTTAWKGIYFNNFNFKFPTTFDGSNQIVLTQEQVYNFEALAGNNFYAWVDAFGKNCNIKKAFSGSIGPSAKFNTFKGYLREIQLKLEDNTVANCFIDGFVYIPLLDKDEEFIYHVPFDNNGLQASFLDDDLINYTTTFRPNQRELRLNIIVKQAVFRDNERLDLVIDLDWEAIQAYVPNLTQFKIWGNGETGFNVPGGARGITNVVGRFDNSFEITLDSVAAGFFGGTYAFNCISSIVLGDEKVGVSGTSPTGPPKVSLLTDEERIPPTGHGPPPPIATLNYTDQTHWDTYNNGAAEEMDKGEMVVFIPFYLSYPCAIGGTLVAAGIGAAIGAGAAAGAGGNPGVGAGIGAGAGASLGSQAFAGKKVASVVGFLMYTKGDPEWGNVFAGMASISIEKPLQYGVTAKLIIGKKKGVHYGLFEMFYQSNAIDYSKLGSFKDGVKDAGKYIAAKIKRQQRLRSNAVTENTTPDKKIIIGSYNVVEIGGRFYWNMSHSVEAECGENFESIVQLGAAPGPANGTDVDTAAILTGAFTQAQIIDAMSDSKLAEMLCGLRENDRESFRTLLNGLPPPDFNFLASQVTEIPQSVWNTLAAANVNSYSHLELLFPDDWCENEIMKTVIIAAREYWKANNHTFNDTMSWGNHCANQILRPDFGDFCSLTPSGQTKTLDRIQSVQPAEEAFVINHYILNKKKWDTMVQAIGTPVTWNAIHQYYPDLDWCHIIPSVIELDWAQVWGDWLPDSPEVDLLEAVKKYAPTTMGVLKKAFSSIFGNIILPALNAFKSGDPSLLTNYRVDDSIDFGFMFTVRVEDLPTLGRTNMYKGTLEMSFGDGKFSQFLLRVDAGWGNRPHPSDTDGSLAKGKACITYTAATKTFIADLQAQAIAAVGPTGFCGQGMLHFESSPGEIHMEIGNRDFPIVVGPCGIAGLAWLGWAEIHHTPTMDKIGLGIGRAITVYLQTPRLGADGCNFYAYFDAYAAIAVFGEITIPETGGVSGQVGVLVGAGVDLGVNFSGAFCPFGNINCVHLYLGGELVFELPSGNGHLAASGEATLFGCISAHFKFNKDFDL